jgi:hypothetical protein
MSTFTENEIVYCHGYKTYGDLKYHLNFPDEWILDELPDTGRECANCVGEETCRTGYAMWRGIVIGYCSNCAVTYDGKRGPGFYGHGVEDYMENTVSAYETYLANIDLENAGELAANPDDTMENYNISYNELHEMIQDELEKKIDAYELSEIQRMSEECDSQPEDDWNYGEEIYYGQEESYDEYDEPICCLRKCTDYATYGSRYCSLHKEQYDQRRKVIKENESICSSM